MKGNTFIAGTVVWTLHSNTYDVIWSYGLNSRARSTRYWVELWYRYHISRYYLMRYHMIFNNLFYLYRYRLDHVFHVICDIMWYGQKPCDIVLNDNDMIIATSLTSTPGGHKPASTTSAARTPKLKLLSKK